MVTYRYTMTKWPAILVSAVLPLRGQPILVNLCDSFIKSMEMNGFQRAVSARITKIWLSRGRVFELVEMPAEEKGIARIEAEKEDGTPVLTGTASIGPDYGETEIDIRMSRLRPSEQLVILSDLKVGQLGAGNPESAEWGLIKIWGRCIPFSSREIAGYH